MADLRTQLSTAHTRDQIYTEQNIFQIPLMFNKTLSMESLSTIVKNRNIYSGSRDSFILTHSTNGKLSLGSIGVGGNQIVLGNSNSSLVLQRVTNPNNIYKDFLRDELHWDGDGSTASIDIVNHKITF